MSLLVSEARTLTPSKTPNKRPSVSASTTEIERSEYDDLDPRVHERRWLILGVLCLSLVIIVIDNSILNVAIPSLIRDLDASNSQLQWIIDAYVIVFAGLLLTTGSMSDRFGRKGALQAGLALFALGSIASASAQTADQLIFTRAFMGIGGALIMPSTLSILTNVFRNPTERGRAIGVWAGLSGLAVAIGPVVGGLLLKHFSWQSVFWVNIPIAATALILGAFIVPKSHDPRQSRLDPLGAVLSIAGLVTLLFGIIEGPSKGWTSTQVLLAFGIAIVTLAVVRPVGVPHGHSDARHESVQESALQRRQLDDHLDVLRAVRVAVPHYAVLAARARLLGARGGCPSRPVRDDDDDRRPTVGPAGGEVRHQDDRAHRPQPGHRRTVVAIDAPTAHPVPVGARVLHGHGRRHGDDDGAGDRVGDGIAAA